MPKEAEYHSLSSKIGNEWEYFAGKLSEEDKERFEKWNEMIFDCEYMTEYANFVNGFKMGAMLVFEILTQE